ncbi:PepSY-associated TM helix domain-containing protein [Sinomicrobium weinanense]|uniref:PepSY domain-containing protein n=1 Tax=Sinomicrobium weinanense TaxID=2842200 RepID=A0A926JRH7_9FLAO|nr:PepSY-associated TM helix domain-containing protein [Sinomicrobium weinanense]MBC9795974.1 PepSY domain-containing protein [Sinomicrobium weinanense]MBU3122093.1 PepSY domain-containing protein [Sinomicrobium weinanense]
MSNRIYNVLFNTHTISGIVISAALYVIFFAGSFSFFRDEIISWERNEPVKEVGLNGTDFDRLLDTISLGEPVYGRDITFNQYYEERRVNVSLTPSKDTLAPKEAATSKFFYMDKKDFGTYDYFSNYSIGEFLYRLHFFAQLNFFGTSGYLLAGLVAFFFLFAVITGVLVHWNKIVTNFYNFRPRAKLKTLWTDAHTTLGILGLPYQFVYALTGTYLIISTSLMAPPVVALLYDNDAGKMYQDFGIGNAGYAMNMEKQESPVSVNALVQKTKNEWKDFEVKTVTVYNYGDTGMHVSVEGVPSNKMDFTGKGKMVFEASTGEVVYEKSPFGNTSYLDGAVNVLQKLHFGDFGGLGLRIIYFILGMVSCFVIISGVMIWLVARDRKSVSEKKRRFNAWLVWIYLAICLSMYPATALTFVGVKAFVHDFDPSRITWIYRIFFYSWLLLSVLFTVKRDNYFTNKYTLISGSLIGFLVPVVNGVVSGNWMWITLSAGDYGIFFIDAFWIILSVTTLIVGLKLKRKQAAVPVKKVKRSPQEKKHALIEEV